MTSSPRRAAWRHIGLFLVIAVGGALLLATAGSGLREISSLRSPSNVASWDLEQQVVSCLTGQVERVVPPGDWAYISERSVLADLFAVKDPMVAGQLSSVVARYWPRDPGHEHVELRLVQVRRSHGCLGFRVKAVWPDGSVHFGRTSLHSTTPLPAPQ